jgi:hypothetical protein
MDGTISARTKHSVVYEPLVIICNEAKTICGHYCSVVLWQGVIVWNR